MTTQYFCTRPSLASRLMLMGFQGKRTVNIYDSTRPAWVFDESAELLAEVNRYFAERGETK